MLIASVGLFNTGFPTAAEDKTNAMALSPGRLQLLEAPDPSQRPNCAKRRCEAPKD